MHVQLKTESEAAGAIQRAFHSKAIRGRRQLKFVGDLPGDLSAGFAQPGKSYPAIVRFSNASGSQPDYKADLRGVALRIKVSDGEQHDLLATNFPVSHARNARQFVAFAKATAGGTLTRLVGIVGLAFKFGPSETIRMLRNIAAGRRRKVSSLALETFWSRGAIRWGDTLAVRYLLRPAPGAASAPQPSETDPDFLSNEFARRLDAGNNPFRALHPALCRCDIDADRGHGDRMDRDAHRRRIKVADARRSAKPASGIAEAFTNARVIDELAFNPWNTTEEFRPLGNLNRARKVAYDASAAHRLAYRFRIRSAAAQPCARRHARARPSRSSTVASNGTDCRCGSACSTSTRSAMCSGSQNLIDTDVGEAPPKARPEPQPPIGEDVRLARSYDGTFNDLSVAQDGLRRLDLRPQPEAQSTRPSCSTRPMR